MSGVAQSILTKLLDKYSQELVDTTVNEAKLTAIYEEAEGSGYIGYIAELPGANTQGETLDEAPENLLEAMRMILEANREEAESRLSDKPGITREQLTLRAA